MFLKKYSFAITAFFLILFESAWILKGQWTGDFWEHSAVVNELSRHFLHPGHPILNVETSHVFYSPYSLLVALFSMLTKLDPIASLACFAFFNLLFFLFSYYLFCQRLFKEDKDLIAALSLVLLLLFWGVSPIIWSGFFHFRALNYVLPYPSTFSLSLSLLILAVIAGHPVKPSFYRTSVLIILSAVVFITHPTTALFLFIGIASMNFVFSGYSVKRSIIPTSVLIVPAIFLSFLWPYYDIYNLIFINNGNFHKASFILYQDLLARYWPLLFALPGMLLAKKDKISGFLIIALILMTLFLTFGYISGRYGIGRLISNMMMFSSLIIAYTLGYLFKEKKIMFRAYSIFLTVGIIISLVTNRTRLIATFSGAFRQTNIEYYNKYSFLNTFVKPDDLILSDEMSNWIIPTYSGKVIASFHPLYGIENEMQRNHDVDTFFTPGTPDSLRQLIIEKYKPDFILIDSANIPREVFKSGIPVNGGDIVYSRHGLELIRIN